ncbi:MAG TPA: DNA-binding protein [Eubacterium sp.]|nr:DNA-binding protein [Eubacterium sp.]
MDYKNFEGKNVDDAITNACQELGITSDKLDYEVVEEGGSGFLGLGKKAAVIKARKKGDVDEIAADFLNKVFDAMELTVKLDVNVEDQDNEQTINIDIVGDDMGVLIGKRGQTLDSLQYLTSLIVNKESDDKFSRVRLDTENYRERRQQTLENLAKNIAKKVKRIKKPVALEPMNPYERRIIHSALQDDKYCTTRSEGEEPYRHVVVVLK